ncbi:MAG: ABC transporter substrate-binding protein, partial [Nevskiales bacterium]
MFARIVTIAITLALIGSGARAETELRVGWCARTVSAAAAPYAIAQKMGWFGERGLKVIVTPLPGSTDCVKEVATGELLFSVPSIEPLAIIHPQGVKAKIFYT